MYHRIATVTSDVWELAVSPACFEQHLHACKQFAAVLTTEELTARLRARSLTGRSIVITFDDGYEDNFTAAKPLLESFQLPATFFVTSNCLTQTNEYWWDELETIFLLTDQLPPLFSLPIGNGESF
jgi:peptidoglycan/xylan/chitin deacetylase (PgdA/CDA1 family)